MRRSDATSGHPAFDHGRSGEMLERRPVPERVRALGPGARVTWRDVARTTLALFFVAAGVLHFVIPAYYRAIIPSYLPSPATLVAVSGAAEIAGGIGLLVPGLRPAAGVGIIILLVALLPANIEMLLLHRTHGGIWWQELLLWLRLPFQAVLAWWVWRLSRR